MNLFIIGGVKLIKTSQSYLYNAFGFVIKSDLELPEIPQITIGKYEISISERCDLDVLWEKKKSNNEYFVFRPQFVIFRVPNIAIFLIKDGNEINYYAYKQNVDDYIRLYLLGTCMGAILMQRKILPIHGSAIARNGEAIAIVGDSGAGKSTLASALLNKGYELISDDVIPIKISSSGTPMVVPSYPQQKLWKESLINFGMETDQFRPIVDRELKYAVPVNSKFTKSTLKLTRIYELVKTEENDINIRTIKKLECFHTLYYNTYRNFFLKEMNLLEWHFNLCALMINKLKIYQLKRPITKFSVNELADIIE